MQLSKRTGTYGMKKPLGRIQILYQLVPQYFGLTKRLQETAMVNDLYLLMVVVCYYENSYFEEETFPGECTHYKFEQIKIL